MRSQMGSEQVPLERALVDRCYEAAKAERWTLSRDAFAALLTTSASRAFADAAPPTELQLERYVLGLHLEDLALACACAQGHEAAWDHFVMHYRPLLYRAADSTSDPARAREVADSLYAELFGLRIRDGQRQSHFRYFHGRSSLATWLRAVLAQRCIDAWRGQSRLDTLPDDDSPGALSDTRPARPTVAPQYLELLRRVISAVVATLAPRERLRLRYYYAHDLTLAQIGQLFGEHEATVSRNLAKTRRVIGKQVEETLREREKLSAAEISECFAAASEDSGLLDLVELLGSEPGPAILRKQVVPDRSK